MRNAALTLLVSLVAGGCGSSPISDPALSEAVESLRTALSRRDFDALWALTDTPTREALLAGLREADTARSLVPKVWPESDRPTALAALGQSLLAQPESPEADESTLGPRLLAASLSPEALTFDEGTLEGLAMRDITFDPGPPRRALVLTLAGERLSFVDEAGQWKSLLARDLILESASFKSLVAQARKTIALAEERDKAWRMSLDPRTPQGAYNLARAAQERRPVDVDMLFALLDEEARKAIADLIEAARQSQRQIQQRTAKALRKDAYRNAGILHLVDAGSDRELFRKWATGSDYAPLLAATDTPMKLAGDEGSGSVEVLTESGARVPMRKDSDGYWRMAGLRDRLSAALGPRPTNGDRARAP